MCLPPFAGAPNTSAQPPEPCSAAPYHPAPFLLRCCQRQSAFLCKTVVIHLCHSDLWHSPGAALLLQLLCWPNTAVEVPTQPEAQRAGGMAAEGCNVTGADSPKYATAQTQLLKPWQVPPHCWPEVMRDGARYQCQVRQAVPKSGPKLLNSVSCHAVRACVDFQLHLSVTHSCQR
jgi:hypothetical protein